jgi:Ala-tRNA(Pro) deacylase
MLELLDIRPGSVSVLGLMNDRERRVHLLVDEDVLKQTHVGCHPCVNTSTLRFSTKDLLEKILPATGHTVQTVHLVGEA